MRKLTHPDTAYTPKLAPTTEEGVLEASAMVQVKQPRHQGSIQTAPSTRLSSECGEKRALAVLKRQPGHQLPSPAQSGQTHQ